MSTDKMNTSAVFEMFEEINKKLDRRTDKQAEPLPQADTTSVNTLTERLEQVIDEVHKPKKVVHRHTVDIGSSRVFISMVVMGLLILGFLLVIGNQRRTIRQYRENDLKYRYVKMQGQTDEENLYRLERQFRYEDSVKIVRKQVEKYEELVREQAERTERARRNATEAEKLQKEAETLRERK